MKRKRGDRAERRRTIPEIDLINEGRSRAPSIPKISRRGCAQLFGQVLMLVVLIAAAWAGLH